MQDRDNVVFGIEIKEWKIMTPFVSGLFLGPLDWYILPQLCKSAMVSVLKDRDWAEDACFQSDGVESQ